MCEVELFYGDCFNEIRKIPDRSVQLILTDPPCEAIRYRTGLVSPNQKAGFGDDLTMKNLEMTTPEKLLPEFKRILRYEGNVFIFCSYHLMRAYHTIFDTAFDISQFMVWHKTNPVPNRRKFSFLNSCEFIVCWWNKGHIWNFTQQNKMHNFIETPVCMGKERLKNPRHPAQKPIKILEHIIEIASCEGGTVCDMFSGVGSTGVAAVNLRRNFIGIECQRDYFLAGQKRIYESLQKKRQSEFSGIL